MSASSVVEIPNWRERAPAEGEVVEVEVVKGDTFRAAVEATCWEYAVDKVGVQIVVVVVEFSEDGTVLVVELGVDEGEASWENVSAYARLQFHGRKYLTEHLQYAEWPCSGELTWRSSVLLECADRGYRGAFSGE